AQGQLRHLLLYLQTQLFVIPLRLVEYAKLRGVDTLEGEKSAMKPAKKSTQKSPKSTTATRKEPTRFTDEELGAMRERVQELKAGKADGESAVLAKIAAFPQPDRAMAERLHAIIKTN